MFDLVSFKDTKVLYGKNVQNMNVGHIETLTVNVSVITGSGGIDSFS